MNVMMLVRAYSRPDSRLSRCISKDCLRFGLLVAVVPGPFLDRYVEIGSEPW